MTTTVISLPDHQDMTVEILCSELIKLCNKGHGKFKVVTSDKNATKFNNAKGAFIDKEAKDLVIC